jgi:glutamate 5-kinase
VDARGRARRLRLRRLAGEIGDLRAGGTRVCVVSSGAVALGLGRLGALARPGDLPALQAASAVGQGLLVAAWQEAFRSGGTRVGQVLLTAHDVRLRASYLNARATLEALLRAGAVPIVNENDSTATDEISFGDNDALAAQVAALLGARLLLLLTDADGVYTRDPREPDARPIAEVQDHRLLAGLDVDAASASGIGSGGMRSKVVAAEMASTSGIPCVIASGARPGVIAAAAAGRAVGTRFPADRRPVSAFKLWLRYGKPAAGRLVVDDGARNALVGAGASLLSVGVRTVEGRFSAGDAVALCGLDGEEFGKGLAAVDASTLRKAAGRRSGETSVREAVHRDYLVLYGDRSAR